MRSPILACTLILASLDIGTVAAKERFHFQKPLMGTKFQIILYAEDSETAEKAAKAAFQKAQQVEDACSDYSPDSELSILMEAPSALKVSPLLADVLEKSLTIAKETQGAFDPTIGGHSRNWRRAKTRGKLPSIEEIHAAKKITDWRKLTISNNMSTKNIPGMRIDLGGIAKGYAADLMLDTLNHYGITIATIAAGGDVRLGDPPPGKDGWRIGLKTLTKESGTPYITTSNCAVSTSGDLHQFIEIDGQRYSHIVNPTTGLGLTQRVSATVISTTAARADALATACCVSEIFAKSLLVKTNQEKLLLATITLNGRGIKKTSPHFPAIHTAK